MPRVLSTKEFDTWEKLLPKEYADRISKLIAKLKKTHEIGKPISDKKSQQETIDGIKNKLDFYKESIKKIL